MKKKVLKLILITILALPIFVYADGIWGYSTYNAYVNDKNGADIEVYNDEKEDNGEEYNKTLHLEYKTNVKVYNEYEKDGIKYANILLDSDIKKIETEDHYSISYDDTYIVELDKISLYKEEYNEDDFIEEIKFNIKASSFFETYYYNDISEIKKEKMLLLNNEIEVYAGPSTKFKKMDFTLKKEDIVDYYDSSTEWLYIEKDGKFGWIADDNKLKYLTKSPNIWLLEDVDAYKISDIEKLYDEKKPFVKAGIKIPKNEKFNNIYYMQYELCFSEIDSKYEESGDSCEGSEEYYRVIYNDEVYYVSNKSKIARDKINYAYIYTFVTGDKFLTAKETKAYDEIDGKELLTIPANTVLNATYYYDTYNKKKHKPDLWLYITYNDKNYWVKNDTIASKYEEETYLSKDVTNYYKTPDGKKAGSIPENTEVEGKYSFGEWIAIKIDNKFYWVNEDDFFDYYKAEEQNSEDNCFETIENYYLYDKYNGNGTTIFVPEKTKVCYKYYESDYNGAFWTHWYYIDNLKNKGWINILETNSYLEKYNNTQNKTKEQNQNNKTIKNDEPKKVNENNNKTNKIKKNYIYAGCTFGITIILVVILLIIYKKRNKVEIQPKEDNNNTLEH